MNVTAIDILKILKLPSTGYRAMLEKYAEEKGIKLPDFLCDFIDMTAGSSLFSTADVWTGLPVLYSELLERNEGEVPKELEEHLLIGSDCGAGVAVFGIKMEDLNKENPPVYIHIEGNDANDWQCLFDSVSEFLMTCLCDVLACVNYDTATRELEKSGFRYQKLQDKDKIQDYLTQRGMAAKNVPKYKSIYGTAAQYSCFYEKDLEELVIVRSDEGEQELYVYTKFG